MCLCVCGKCWRSEVLTVCDNVTLQIQYGYVTNDSNTIKDIQDIGVNEKEKKEQKKMKSKQNQMKKKVIKIIEQQQ